MIYIYRTLYALFYIPVFFLECIAFLLGVIIYPLVEGVAYILTGMECNYYGAMLAERIDKEYSKLKEQIEKQKCL